MSTPTHQPPAPPDSAALTGAQARLWTALTHMPGATAAELATTAAIGRSTAGKTLIALEEAGLTYRHPGGFDGKRRLPDHWYPATTPHSEPQQQAPSTTGPDITDQPPTGPETDPNRDRPTITSLHTTAETGGQPTTPPEPAPQDHTPTSGHDDAPDDHRTQADAAPAPSPAQLADATTAPASPPDAKTGHSESPDQTPPVTDDSGDAALAEPVTDRQPVTGTAGNDSPPSQGSVVYGSKQRRAPGELRHRVLAFLQDRPGQEWGPTGLSRHLEASSGAISNALDRLVTLGLAQRTNDKPRRFTATTPDQHTPQS